MVVEIHCSNRFLSMWNFFLFYFFCHSYDASYGPGDFNTEFISCMFFMKSSKRYYFESVLYIWTSGKNLK